MTTVQPSIVLLYILVSIVVAPLMLAFSVMILLLILLIPVLLILEPIFYRVITAAAVELDPNIHTASILSGICQKGVRTKSAPVEIATTAAVLFGII